MDRLKVIIEVSGGVAIISEAPPEVDVIIIDHDNEQAEQDAAYEDMMIPNIYTDEEGN
jgi:spermidine synthase